MLKKETFKVLIIEDDLNSNLTLKNILKIGQYSVRSSICDVRIEEVLKLEPEIIILKLPLQTRNGFEVLKNLKTNENTKHIPVVIITKLNTQLYWEAAYQLGADAYIVTPRHYPYILRKLNRVRSKTKNWNNYFIQNTIAI
ncbi:MAG: two-component system response regulator [Marinifilaceae bacterium]|jgi:response regulator RpfG family c-di-GMP phosphodiesterase